MRRQLQAPGYGGGNGGDDDEEEVDTCMQWAYSRRRWPPVVVETRKAVVQPPRRRLGVRGQEATKDANVEVDGRAARARREKGVGIEWEEVEELAKATVRDPRQGVGGLTELENMSGGRSRCARRDLERPARQTGIAVWDVFAIKKRQLREDETTRVVAEATCPY